jgi:hypothetical protein
MGRPSRCELLAPRSFAVVGQLTKLVGVREDRSNPMRLLYSSAVRFLRSRSG